MNSKKFLHCYGRQVDLNKWYGVCLDFNLAVEASSLDEMREEMKEVIKSYLEAVLDTKDVISIPTLLNRRAPLADWLFYYYVACMYHITNLPKKKLFNFKEVIPDHLAPNHC